MDFNRSKQIFYAEAVAYIPTLSNATSSSGYGIIVKYLALHKFCASEYSFINLSPAFSPLLRLNLMTFQPVAVELVFKTGLLTL